MNKVNTALKAIDKLFEKNPKLMDKIIKEVDKMASTGPTAEEYFNKMNNQLDPFWIQCFYFTQY